MLNDPLETLIRRMRREACMADLDRLPVLDTCPHCGGHLDPDASVPATPPPAPISAETPPEHPDETWRRQVLATADARWRERIVEPPAGGDEGREAIEGFIRGIGWGSVNIKNPGAPYKNGAFSWCGCFAGHCLASAGFQPELHTAALRKKYAARPLMIMSSCYRIVAEWATGTPRLIKDHRSARPGDIAIVGQRSGRWWGAHITIVRDVRDDRLLTVEGNAKGTGPDGSRYEGVIHMERPFVVRTDDDYHVMHIVRPLPADFPRS